MTTNKSQSQIAEVRDQLSLDYSDGKYLNVATANLGITRPPWGFSDDTWRAIVKSLALQAKQITTKFHDLLSILLGPRLTAYATQPTASVSGDQQVIVNDSSLMPQVGIIIFDEGMATAETLAYCFIDRATNTIFLEEKTVFAHAAHSADVSAPILFPASAADATVQIHVAEARLITTTPVTAVVGLGTANEETLIILSVDATTGIVTLATGLTNTHSPIQPSPIQNQLSKPYTACAEFITLTDSDAFDDTGYVILGPSSTVLTATGGTANTVTYTSGDLSDSRHQGNFIVFDGNITAALAGVTGYVASNTTTAATFRNTLPGTPVSGDTFKIRPILKYTRNVLADNALQITRDIADVDFAASTEVELLDSQSTLSLTPLKIVGTGWDVIQSDPRNIELLIPEALQDVNTVRSASYVHPAIQGPLSTTMASPSTAGDTILTLADSTIFPPFGQVFLDNGGSNEEKLGYRRVRIVDTYESTGSTSTLLKVTTGGLTVSAHIGDTVFIGNSKQGLDTSRTVTANAIDSFTLDYALTSADLAGLVNGETEIWVYHSTNIEIVNQVTTVNHLVAETVEYDETAVLTTLQSGDLWSTLDTFPGPYLYDLSRDAPDVAASNTSLATSLAGPTTLVATTSVLETAMEVADASLFPLGAVSPFKAVVGRTTGNNEIVTISDVNLKQRASTTISTGSTVGDTFVPVTALTGAGVADDFPNVRGYRVLIDRGGSNEEIVYVIGTTTSPSNGLTVENTDASHVAGETIELLADVISVDPLDDTHIGFLSAAQKKLYRAPVNTTSTLSLPAAVGDSTITIVSSIGFPTSGRIRLQGVDYSYSLGVSNIINILDAGGIVNAAIAVTPVYVLVSQNVPEVIEVQYTSVTVASTTGFPTAGGSVLLNYGRGVIDVEGTLSAVASPTDLTLTLVSTATLPTTYPYEVVLAGGTGEYEERLLVTNNNTGTNVLTVDAIKFSHSVGTKVSFRSGDTEKLTYTSIVGSDLRFSTPFVLQSLHQPSETVVQTTGLSISSTTGTDFPLRMPTDLLFRIEFLFDLVRAAGIQVTVITQR